jgi:DNA repair exonuclease SbcCD nuclease subunit
MLDSSYYKALDRESLKLASGTKIFLFHSAISELKQNEHMDSISLSYLPEGFDYYAGGHVHDPLLSKAKGWVAMPGPLFPNSFAELEKLEYGSMVLCRLSGKSITPELLKLPMVDVLKLALDCTGKSCEQINDELKAQISPENTHGKLVLIRLTGLLGSGKISDIDFGGVYKRAKGAVFIMRNTAQVRIKEFENIRVEPGSVEDVELRLISEHKSGIQLFNGKEEAVVAELLGILSKEKGGGETKGAYEDRIVGEALLHARKHTP